MKRTTPELAPPPSFHTTPAGGRLTSYVLFNVQLAQYTTDHQWNWVSNLEPPRLRSRHLNTGPPRTYLRSDLDILVATRATPEPTLTSTNFHATLVRFSLQRVYMHSARIPAYPYPAQREIITKLMQVFHFKKKRSFFKIKCHLLTINII
ncbi:hypothetical protein AVEN_37956-1 [Araneus ventricosus]|uniref:Uncharacterized protein n=1 Tax=Araneus ventricosus TaxID=182803 RepID=A0A4Y2CJH6_ARAVE|nr:hypothetical protein AVEN_37956-1 [Araneus ventricosus]